MKKKAKIALVSILSVCFLPALLLLIVLCMDYAVFVHQWNRVSEGDKLSDAIAELGDCHVKGWTSYLGDDFAYDDYTWYYGSTCYILQVKPARLQRPMIVSKKVTREMPVKLMLVWYFKYKWLPKKRELNQEVP